MWIIYPSYDLWAVRRLPNFVSWEQRKWTRVWWEPSVRTWSPSRRSTTELCIQVLKKNGRKRTENYLLVIWSPLSEPTAKLSIEVRKKSGQKCPENHVLVMWSMTSRRTAKLCIEVRKTNERKCRENYLLVIWFMTSRSTANFASKGAKWVSRPLVRTIYSSYDFWAVNPLLNFESKCAK